MKRAAVGAFVFACGLIPLVAGAQKLMAPRATAARGPVLHEDLPPGVRPETPATADITPIYNGEKKDPRSQILGPTAAGQNPSAIAADDKLIPEPGHLPAPKSGEPVFGKKDFGADRQTELRPDYATGGDDTLHYAAVFNPAIIPFKRMSALDQVAADYSLGVMAGPLTELAVGGSPDPDRDVFWASLVIAPSPGERVPIPSVAPDMRILSYESEPAVALAFSKDGADNYYVTAQAGGDQTIRLVMAVDAAATYFAPSIPEGYRVYDIARAPGAISPRPLPDAIRRSASRALNRLGISRRTALDDALNTLIYYFRSFAPKTPPPASGDIYWDLFASQAGVCRHRSYAFMITANALGIPTRLITNEAHAFVESWVPDQGWIRIDLGGAADVLEAANTARKTMYQPRSADPFAKPQPYRDGYTRLSGDIRGLSPRQLDEAPYRREPGTTPSPSPRPDRPDIQPAPADTDFHIEPERDIYADEPDRPGPDETEPESWLGPDPLTEGDPAQDSVIDPSLPAQPDDTDPSVRPTTIVVTSVDEVAYRGEALTVSGNVLSEGSGVGGLRVDLFLALSGTLGADAINIGSTISQADGTFSTTLTLPVDLSLNVYVVIATTPGDADHESATSWFL